MHVELMRIEIFSFYRPSSMRNIFVQVFQVVVVVLLLVWTVQPNNNSCRTGVEEIFNTDSNQVLLSKWLQHHWSNLTSTDLQIVFRGCILEQRDSLFGGTILSQIARSYQVFPINLITRILHYLKDEGYDVYLIMMDNDGDIPLHSAIKGMADPAYVLVFASTIPKYTQHSLKAKNNKEYVPLDLAFELGHFQAVQVLLELSIEHEVLAHLTGVHALSGTTLLHKAFKRGHLEYFQSLLTVCAKLNTSVLPVLLVPDSKGNTPWYYLISRNKHHEIEQVMYMCQKYEIDVNQVYLDPQRKTTMLHEAIRKNDRQCEKILRKWGAKDKPDNKGLWPSQRNHRLSSNGIQSHLNYHPITSVKDLYLMLEDVGNWEALCVNLGIRTGLIDELRHSRLEVSVLKLRCIEAYVNDGEASWEDVALAVILYPIQNIKVSNKIRLIYLDNS